jgi:hypothetical protein
VFQKTSGGKLPPINGFSAVKSLSAPRNTNLGGLLLKDDQVDYGEVGPISGVQ